MTGHSTRVIFLFGSLFFFLTAPFFFAVSQSLGASSFTFSQKEDESVFSEYWVFIRNVNLYDLKKEKLYEKMDVLVVNENIHKIGEAPTYFVDVDLTYNINGEGRTLVAGMFTTAESTAKFKAHSFIEEGVIADLIVIDLHPVEDPDDYEKILKISRIQKLHELREVCLIMKAGEIIKNTLPDTKIHRVRLQKYQEKRKMANEQEGKK